MPGKTVGYIRRLSAPREIEDSRQLRIAVWASVSISILALALQGVTSFALALGSIALISAGSYWSWRRRYKPNILLKIFIMVLTLAALISFLRQVFLQPYDPRIPLAELFVWVQVLHSFDLPRGKDLLLSLVSSLVILALAGSFSLSAAFGWIILLWLVAAVPALYYVQQSRLYGLSDVPVRSTVSRSSLKSLLVIMVVVIVSVVSCGLAIGAFMPRVSATYLRSLPFSIRRAFLSSDGYKFANPGYPGLPIKPPDSALEVNPEAYFGFAPYLDLRSRGTLVDLPVMKVRSTEPAYWSGQSFQEYNGYSWLTPEEEPVKLHASVQPFNISYDPNQAHLATRAVIQTYYIEAEQPSVIFASFRPEMVYYPADYIYQDESGLKSPFPLDDGLVYSVISRHIVNENILSASRMEVKEGALLPYLELPPLPERVLVLANEIIPWDAGPYGRALAIEDYLKAEYEYSLDVPPLPSGEDAVDYFLFEHRRGYCEHFASAYAVLCRLAGIPSRVVTGYSTGEYNPFSGLYEVTLDDAHAWVEIYLEGIGWVTSEPTPSFNLPEWDQGSGGLWIFKDFFNWIGNNLSAILPASLRSALKSGLAALASSVSAFVSGFLYSVGEAPWLFMLFILILLLYPLLKAAGKLRGRRAPPPAELDGPLLAMREFLRALEGLGLRRSPSQTAGEYVGELSALVPELNLSGELVLFERARYGGESLQEEDVSHMRKSLAEALEKVRAYTRTHRRGHAPSAGAGK
jgi:transglutaminase-like putative cysteine protease